MEQNQDKPYVWSSERIGTVLMVTGIMAFVIGSVVGWNLGTDQMKDIVEVWEYRAQSHITKSNNLEQAVINRDATIDSLTEALHTLPVEIQEIKIELAESAYNYTVAVMELEEYKDSYLELQQEHVRLQIAYQALWDVWWNASH